MGRLPVPASAVGAPPQDAAKQDGDHRTPFQQHFWMSGPFLA
jgi:hypothetical protein